MALVLSNYNTTSEKNARKSSFGAEKGRILRDYLKDDMSSCSSNGFKSFPRRQCCVAVKNILDHKEVTLAKAHHHRITTKPPNRTMFIRNKRVSSIIQKASMAVINAVKLLPFNTSTDVTSVGGVSGRRLLPRSFSKKLFKKSFFWKTKSNRIVVDKNESSEGECDEIERWISSGVVGTEIYQPLDLSNDTTLTTTTSDGSNMSSDGKSDRWSDITFNTSDCFNSSLSENDGVVRREKAVVHGGFSSGDDEMAEEEEVSASSGGSTVEATVNKSDWSMHEEVEKEQFSPVSVMDFPYNDEGSASPFTLRATRLRGTTERLMKNLGRFESMAAELALEPINLESLMSSSIVEDHSSKRHSIQPCSTPSYIMSSESETGDDDEDKDEDEEEESPLDEAEIRVQHLLDTVKLNIIPSKTTYQFNLDNLLLDFFRENNTQKADYTLLKAVEDWIDGQYDKLILGWEVEDKRQAYIRDMEEGGMWPRDTKLEKEEVAVELETMVLEDLIKEVMVEFCSSEGILH